MIWVDYFKDKLKGPAKSFTLVVLKIWRAPVVTSEARTSTRSATRRLS